MSTIYTKKNYLASLFLTTFLVAPIAMADGNRHHQPDFNRLADKLEVSEEQRPEFISIMEAQMEKRKTIMSSIRSERREKMDEHVQDTRSALSGVLTGEQLQAFDEMVEKRREKMMAKKKRFQQEG